MRLRAEGGALEVSLRADEAGAVEDGAVADEGEGGHQPVPVPGVLQRHAPHLLGEPGTQFRDGRGSMCEGREGIGSWLRDKLRGLCVLQRAGNRTSKSAGPLR